MKPIDMLKMGPQRHAVKNDVGWRVTVTPPGWSGFSASSIQLTDDQYDRYLKWQQSGDLIQQVFPDLTAAQCEVLMTGISDQEFHQAFADDED